MSKVILQNIRFSYVNVWEPKAMEEGQQPKYSCTILIPKNHPQLAEIEKAIEDAKKEGKDTKFGGKIPAALKTPLRDGDEEREDHEECKGCMFINANSTNQPGIVDRYGRPIFDRDDFYSGCYGNVSVTFYPYNIKSKGIAAGLNNVMKTKEGDRLSGAASAAEDFAQFIDNSDDPLA